MTKPLIYVLALLALVGMNFARPIAQSQKEVGPKVEKTYGDGLPRDAARIIFSDAQNPVWPLTPAQMQYASIDGARMKRHVVNLAQIAITYRDAGNKWWGRLPGTTADREGMAYMTREFESLGLKVEHFPYVLPEDWRPTDFSASYQAADGKTIDLTTALPLTSRPRKSAPAPTPTRTASATIGLGPVALVSATGNAVTSSIDCPDAVL